MLKSRRIVNTYGRKRRPPTAAHHKPSGISSTCVNAFTVVFGSDESSTITHTKLPTATQSATISQDIVEQSIAEISLIAATLTLETSNSKVPACNLPAKKSRKTNSTTNEQQRTTTKACTRPVRKRTPTAKKIALEANSKKTVNENTSWPSMKQHSCLVTSATINTTDTCLESPMLSTNGELSSSTANINDIKNANGPPLIVSSTPLTQTTILPISLESNTIDTKTVQTLSYSNDNINQSHLMITNCKMDTMDLSVL
ncbi:hypothetical protein BDF19DRAFT_8483 [Syncephalis fuscata]|nr:hypothetical protein BDF19DRAFT_8483 [Syncephalis fuscata]